MAWVEVALAPGLALPGSSLAHFSALHAFPCQENSLSKIMLLLFSSGTVAAIWKPTSIKQASTGRSELAARLSCLNRHESSSHQRQPQHLWHALSSAGKSASVEFKHSFPQQHATSSHREHSCVGAHRVKARSDSLDNAHFLVPRRFAACPHTCDQNQLNYPCRRSSLLSLGACWPRRSWACSCALKEKLEKV